MLVRKNHLERVVRAARAGFTLMEMMVVVAIIVILIGISVPLVINYLHNAKIDTTKAKIRTVYTALQAYEINNGQVTDLSVLIAPDQAGRQPTIRQQDLVDAWNNPLVLEGRDPNTGQAIIMSPGPPGQNRPLRSNDLQ